MDDLPAVLEWLQGHIVVTGPLPERCTLSGSELAAIHPDDRSAIVHGPGIAAAKQVEDFRAVADAVRALGNAGFEPAVPLLAQLWHRCPVSPVRVQAGHALLRVGTPHAHQVLQEMAADHDHLSAHLAARSLLVQHQGEVWPQVEGLVGPAEDGEIDARRLLGQIVDQLVRAVGPGSTPLGDDAADWMRREPRWLKLAARWRHDRGLGRLARRILGVFPAEQRAEALQSVPEPPRPAPDPDVDYVARYRAGDPTAWDDLCSCRLDERGRAQAEAIATLLMERVRRNAEVVSQRLSGRGWRFRQAPCPALAASDTSLARLVPVIGGTVPVSLAAFAARVHAIDFQTDEDGLAAPFDSVAPERLDPLVVQSVDDVVGYSIDDWLDQNDPDVPELAEPFELPIAPDRYHKMGSSGGMSYSLVLEPDTADCLVVYLPEPIPFVAYLRHALLDWGGLPGLAHAKAVPPDLQAVVDALREGLEPF